MASNGVDPTTGYPLFPEEDAPALGADLEEVAAYAVLRGNTLKGTTTAMNAFAYPIDGMLWSNTTEDAVYRYDGSSWVWLWSDWKSYTPTGTNISGGTLTAKYRRVGKTIDVVIRHVSPTVSGSVSYTLPVAAADSNLHEAGFVTFYDATGTENKGWVRLSTNAILTAANAAGTYLAIANLSSTIPFTWATNDFLEARFSYEVA